MRYFYENFLTALQERHPRKPDLVNALTDVLRIEKESVYRRLRQDVYFSAQEMLIIASAWNISIDNIIRHNPKKTRPFHFNMIEFADPGEDDYSLLEQYNRDLETISGDPHGRMFEVLNSLPRGLYCRSEHLSRFFTMKWLYKSGRPDKARPLCDIHLTDRMRELDKEHIRCVHAFREVHSIHDSRLIENLVSEIVYFRSIGMITSAETVLLRDDLLTLINYLETVAAQGVFPNSGNRMYFYLSHTWIEAEYVLYESPRLSLSLSKLLERNTVASTDREVSNRLINMVQSIKRSSVLMSESNALQQTEFFTRQRQIVMGI